MAEVTQILNAIQEGQSQAAEELLPLVYDELRRLAAARIAQERPGQTLQATALVHEAYLRLVGDESQPQWEHRGHFFAAAAAALRISRATAARWWAFARAWPGARQRGHSTVPEHDKRGIPRFPRFSSCAC